MLKLSKNDPTATSSMFPHMYANLFFYCSKKGLCILYMMRWWCKDTYNTLTNYTNFHMQNEGVLKIGMGYVKMHGFHGNSLRIWEWGYAI